MSSEQEKAELQHLTQKRDQLNSSINRFATFLNKLIDNNPVEHNKVIELQTRLGVAESLWSEFENIQSKIELLTNFENSEEERDAFENRYFEVIALAKQILSECQNTQQNNSRHSSTENDLSLASTSKKNIKLPILELPKFYGDYDKWLNFKDTFLALIDSDTTLNNVTKLHYLISCLKGAAEQTLCSLDVTEENYSVAWNLLHERFENKKVIKRTHLKALVEWPSITRESHVNLRKLADGLLLHLKSLKGLGEPTDMWDTLIVHIFSNKLDPDTKREWEDFSSDIDSPTTANFTSFLSKRCHFLESVSNMANKSYVKGIPRKPQDNYRSFSHITINEPRCYICKAAHFIYKCPSLLKFHGKARVDETKRLKLCTNCLRPSHTTDNCTSGGCRHCGRKHNTILHFQQRASNIEISKHDSTPSSSATDVINEHAVENNNTTVVNNHCSFKNNSEILLSTALVDIRDKNGNFHTCRILLDSGSQSNFIRSDLCDKLHLNKQSINIPIAGINQMATKISHHPSYHSPGKIDVLLGASIFFELLSIGQIKLGDNLPILQKTKLGWVISGYVPRGSSHPNSNETRVMLSHLSTSPSSLEDQMEKFWRIENIDHNSYLSKEEKECEDLFLQTTRRDNTGHFIVNLPIRDSICELGDSFQVALKRFDGLEKRLSRDREFKDKYVNFMQEYQDLGHMTLINNPDHRNNTTFYLPHHGVYKETSSTTKLRVVFDASAKSENGTSLNENLKVGPIVQEDLLSILLRFRKHTFAMVADIEKMYRQVFIEDNQRDLQRILWRSEPSQPLQHFHLNTVTYGTASASFLATRSLQQVGIESQSTYPEASKIIQRDFYVDDVLTGAETIEDAIRLRKYLIQVLDSYGFPLRKWISNNANILKEDLSSNVSNLTHFICDDRTTKTLGILWNSEADIFQYTVNGSDIHRVTKRSILSAIAQIFDPLGLVGPVVVKAKIIMKKLWNLKVDWDETIPADLHTTWSELYHQLSYLNKLEIPRHVICSRPVAIQLHVFSDASEEAYGSCVYLRSTDKFNKHTSRLLCAKSRVAPSKNKISLPRLELCGALLSAQLAHKVVKSLDIKIDYHQLKLDNNIFFWCDSTIAISWIKAEPSRWKTFVANRVSEIQNLTDTYQWRHIASIDNPADVISRGICPIQLLHFDLWWQGPSWLVLNETSWPCQNVQHFSDDLPEQRKCNLTFITQNLDQDIFDRYSSLIKLQRVTAFCLRFRKNLTLPRGQRIIGSLSSVELKASLIALIKLVQGHNFSSEIHALKTSSTVSSKSKLLCLNPFLDSDGLIRVGGRLKESDISYDSKHPIILPNHHPFAKLVILYEHHRHLHAAVQATLYSVRQKYWIINGRSIVRGILRRCVTCFKVKPRDVKYQMGQLPDFRIKPSRPFATVGIDFAGPFFIKDSKYRNKRIVKCYMCMFVCLVTKAVHIELVGDLSTDNFLNALKRMTSRRGLCHTIFTDNGKNFVGANNDMKEIRSTLSDLAKNSSFSKFIKENFINWNFIPPKLPHFGGIWESAVKSAKYHTKRILDKAYLTFEELSTVLTQVEAVLNSRPLTPLSSDPNDLLCLTPAHFLIGEPLTAIPQEDVTDIPTNRLSHYKRLQQLLQHFWARWSREYLNSLQQRTKWKTPHPDAVQVGSLVLLKEDNSPPLYWKLGRVCDIFPGKDGIIRVVNVKFSSGIVKRGVSKICVLPISV